MVAMGMIASFALVAPVFAQTSAPATGAAFGVRGGGRFGSMHGGPGAFAPGVFGTVSAVNGTTLTVTSKARPMPMAAAGAGATKTPSATVYTVDASNAQVLKSGVTSTVSSIATGDTVMVQGTVSGTNVAATMIRDGVMGMMRGPGFGGFGGRPSSTTPGSSTPPIQGNGEPVVGGNVTAVSGNTLTVTNTSNVTYAIDVTNAKIVKNGTTTTVSVVATGDNVIVQGTVNGTSVTASSVIDQGSGNSNQGSNVGGTVPSGAPQHGGGFGAGFFGAIGGFFKHLFGF